jgi:sulfur-oxidizing protein SoxX
MNAKWVIEIAISFSLACLVTPVSAADQTDAELDAKTATIMKRDFHDKGIAKVDRLKQDEVQAICTKFIDKPPLEEMQRLEKQQKDIIKWPADGKFMGDWKAGEKLAQSGAGMTWSDKPDAIPGGNCYNCHRLSAKEIAYGTIGPSLLRYRQHLGKTRTEEEIQRFAYGHIYNAKAYNLCANMPRFGQMGVLSEAQMKDLVALLLDPESPVNK